MFIRTQAGLESEIIDGQRERARHVTGVAEVHLRARLRQREQRTSERRDGDEFTETW